MINVFFSEISEEEMMSVNGGCGGGCNPGAAMMICDKCVAQSQQALANMAKAAISGAIEGAVASKSTYGAITGGIIGGIKSAVSEYKASVNAHQNH